nr:zinc ABC transporter substrate-binding protein [Halarcobacter anaerophilus]
MIKGLPTLKLDNGKSNPYIWLDPILARGIAKNVYINMIKIIPSKQKIFEKNYKEFLKELDKVYLDIKKRIDKSDLYGFFSFNNQLDYFAKRFRINIYHKEEKY